MAHKNKLSWAELNRIREERAKEAGLRAGSLMSEEPGNSPAERAAEAARERRRGMVTSGSVSFKPKASNQADGLEDRPMKYQSPKRRKRK